MTWPLNLAAPPTISAQAETIKAYLENYTEEHGGEVHVMQNPRHLWEYVFGVSSGSGISANTAAPQILVCYMGETSRGGFNQANTLHRVDRQWAVTVLMGHGFKRGISEATRNAVVPFLDVMETLRDGLRVMLNISEEFPVDYKGIQPLPAVGPNPQTNVFIDGYVINFSTANDIPAVETTNPQSP